MHIALHSTIHNNTNNNLKCFFHQSGCCVEQAALICDEFTVLLYSEE